MHITKTQPGGRAAAWLLLSMLLLITSCSPYIDPPRVTPTSVTAVTATVQPVAPSPRSPIATPLPTCTVRTGVPDGHVNLRAGAGVGYAVVRVLDEGERLAVLERAASTGPLRLWLKVFTRGATGFINARYCQ